MLRQPDSAHFDKVWQSKAERGQLLFAAYVPGANPRVDKALQLISRGTRFLDIACGTGVLAAQVKDRFQEVYGVDIAEAPVQIARDHGVIASIVNLNTQPLPFEDGYFSAVTIMSALQYMYDLDFVLGECFRVLSPRGEILICVPNMRTFWRMWKLAVLGTFPRTSLDIGYDGGTLHYFCSKDVARLLRRNGFEVVTAGGIMCLPRFLRRVPDPGIPGYMKREFFSAEVCVKAVKLPERQLYSGLR